MIRQNFNKEWTLSHGMNTILGSVMGNQGSTETVDLPHDDLITRPRYADSVSGPGMAFFEGEDISYSKTFFVPEDERDLVHYLNFDGVYMNAVIRVNGIYVTKHAYGYTPFTIHIDECLKYGKENKIQVDIRGYAQPNARWYPGLGIYRDVTLLKGNLVHILHDGIRVTTMDCDGETGTIEVETDLYNADRTAHVGEARYTVRNAAGETVAADSGKFYAAANSKLVLRTHLDVENPALWDAEHPNLYTCEVTLLEGDKQMDSDEAVFGIRKIRVDSKHGLRINGKTVKLRGGCIHHDNAMLGARSYVDSEMRKIALLKTGGYNAVRTAHNPPSKALLDACDKLGMYVMDEFTDVWAEGKAAYDYGEFFESEWEQDVEDYVRRDYNHPSVILWSIGNEIPETGNVVSDQWGKKLVEKFKSLDRSRPVTNGINIMVSVMSNLNEVAEKIIGKKADGGINDIMFASDGHDENGGGAIDPMTMRTHPAVVGVSQEAADMLDVVGYNYTADLYEVQHQAHPNRVFFGSETNPPKIDYNWDIVLRCPYVIGDFCWTGWDYLGEVGGGRLCLESEFNGRFMADYPYICAYQADFNLIGDRRPMSYWRETVWNGRNHQPYISVHNPARYGMEFYKNAYAWTDSLPTWSWFGQEGKATAVEVYSDAEEVELIVNGASLGRKPVGDSFHKFYTKFETVFQPGKVEAITYIGGREAGRQSLETVENDVGLCVHADKTALRAGSDDLCYIMVELRDGNGTLDMLSNRKVTAKAEGVVLAGMGSGDPMTEEYYHWDAHKLFEGKVLVIVKAGTTAGPAQVTLSCDGVESTALKLTII